MIVRPNDNTPSFTSVTRFLVAKNTFKNSDDYLAVEKAFHKQIKLREYFRLPEKFVHICELFGAKKIFKYFDFMETPFFTNIYETMIEAGNVDRGVLSANSSAVFTKQNIDDYHTFFVFSQNEKNMARDIVSPGNLFVQVVKISQDVRDMVASGKILSTEAPLKKVIILNDLITENFRKLVVDSSIKTVLINNLSEIKAALKQIDF